MSTPTELDFDVAATLAFWIALPEPDADDVAGWAARTARTAVAERGFEPADEERLRALLEALTPLPRPEHYSWRLVFLADPDSGASIWDLAFLHPDADLPPARLVGADPVDQESAQLGAQVDGFAWNGLDGVQAVRFDLTEPDGSPRDEQTITAHARLAVTRDLGGTPTTLLARAETAHLEALTQSLVPMQFLLTSDDLAAAVAGQAPVPSDGSV